MMTKNGLLAGRKKRKRTSYSEVDEEMTGPGSPGLPWTGGMGFSTGFSRRPVVGIPACK